MEKNVENENLYESEPDGFKKCKKLVKELMCMRSKGKEDRNARKPILRRVEIPSPEFYLIEDKSQEYTSRDYTHHYHEPMNNSGVNQMIYSSCHSTSQSHHFHKQEGETVLRSRGHVPYEQKENITRSPVNDGKSGKTSKTENSVQVHKPNNENQLVQALAEISTGDDRYDFNHQQRGYAVLIINSKFDFQSARRSTDWDTYFMKEMFQGLGFETILLENLGSGDLMFKLKDIQSMITTDCDCFACVVSSHGSEGHSTIQGKNEENILRTEHFINTKDGMVRTQELLDLFNDKHCRNLRRKPKLFFIQACRGRLDKEKDDEDDEVDKGVDLPVRDVYSRPGYSSSDSTKPTKMTLETMSNTSESKLDPHMTEAKSEESIDRNKSTPDPQRRYDEYSGRLPAVYQQSELRHRGRYPSHQNTGIQRLNEITIGKNEDPNNIPFIDKQHEYRETRNILRGIKHGYEDYIYEPRQDPYRAPMYRYTAPLELFEIPCHNDFLVMFSSASGTLSWSDSDKGGWLLYCLYKVFKRIIKTDHDLLHILTRVCGKIAVDMKTTCPSTPHYHEAKSAACIYHKLTKDIYLQPCITNT